MQLQSILTILDKPHHAQVALKKSIYLQQLTQATLDLVSFRWDALVDHGKVFDAKQKRQVKQRVLDECADWQEDLLQDNNAIAELTKTRMVWGNDIAHWVADEIAQSSPDLIVKTVHKSNTLLYTPTDWQMLRSCSCPMLFTNGSKRQSIKRILVTLDFKHQDAKHRKLNNEVLRAAHCFAECSGAELHVVYAIEISRVLRDLDVIDERVTKQTILKETASFIEQTLEPYNVPKARRHFPVGKVNDVTRGTAQKMKADLVVVGTWAHKVRDLVGLGNTAQRVLAKLPCDVLAVPPSR